MTKIISKIYLLIVLIITLFPLGLISAEVAPLYIRANQIGFLPNDIKSAVILTNADLTDVRFTIFNITSGKAAYSDLIQKTTQGYGKFKNFYEIHFSELTAEGDYYIEIKNTKSYNFKISRWVYSDLPQLLLEFFKVQRCGYTDPSLHEVCHIADATSLIENGISINKKFDVTGGWHDAGDYVKFLNTTAFSTYMLLFAYDYAPEKFSFDRNKNNVADILEEAKIGLDWLLRCNYEDKKLVTQVQDLRDHDVGWRMPEKDDLAFDRPAFIGMGKNLIGIYSATLAIGAKIWKNVLNYPEYSDKCLKTSQLFYSLVARAQDVDNSGTGMYIDKNYEGKLALAAIELYAVTNKKDYYNDAVKYATIAGSDFWWSWGNINSLAHYRLAKYDIKYAQYILNNLVEFNRIKNNDPFEKGVEATWGTNLTLAGIVLQNILYKNLTKDNQFDSLATYQRDYLIGRNPWGISFIAGKGTVHTRQFHHQINYIKKSLPGGFSAGPAAEEFLKKYNIQYDKPDILNQFQSMESVYRDDRMDYITNEPTISGNATAIFIFGLL
ncbi:MAG: glycoside hydrolase family 9 protein [Melioribacteraceae bacterium]|nr:glycoside hydrolase family 9 protein [Melioribacteraceae bacterium]